MTRDRDRFLPLHGQKHDGPAGPSSLYLRFYRRAKWVISPAQIFIDNTLHLSIGSIYNDLPMTFGFQAALITATAKT